jgi:quinol monooxygenase YgiN
MLWRKALWSLGLLAVILLGSPPALWAQGDYLDVSVVKVKPEKVANFEAIGRKIADANRHNNGDLWLAMQTLYGETNTYVFVSRRQDYAEISKGNDAFMNAMNKAFGKEAADKLLNEVNNCLISWRSELRLRRPDLSSKAPTDAQALDKLVGESRVLRTIAIHVRPGHTADFERVVKEINSHAEHNPNAQPVFVSQVVEGGHGNTFYITFFRSSLGGFDKDPTLKDILGAEGLAKLEKTIADTEASSESAIYRFSPELSNPPQGISEVAADFWQPKRATTSLTSHSKPKPTATAEAKPQP